jgi:peptidoglycan/xylan/chitin deacetylase (PgdA/CDA1 family)
MKPKPYGPFPYTAVIDRPKLTWPDGARLALWVIPNIEFFPLDEKVFFGGGFEPDVLAWSQRDYGARVGIFRIMEVLDRYKIRATVALNSDVCDFYPRIIEEAVKRDWEFMGHNQSNSRPLHQVPPETEGKVIGDTFDRIEQATGARPKGWLSGGLIETWNTLDHLIDAGCEYICDWVNDDQPYLMDVDGRRLVSVPYSSETNDFGAFLRWGMTPGEFDQLIRRQFDTLYREGAESGRVMAISVHPFLIGYPHRIGALDAALEYILGHDGVWLPTGSEIMDHYLGSDAKI